MALAFRYGHLNFVGLKTLQQKDKVTSLPQITIPSQVCEECVVSKQHPSQFPQGKSWRAKSVLELIHSDICGLINPSSNGGKRYLITFIDDYTRKTWVYFLQEKLEAFSAFKSFKAHVENEAERVIKLFALIVEENIAQRNLMFFVMSRVFEGNCLHTTTKWCIGEEK